MCMWQEILSGLFKINFEGDQVLELQRQLVLLGFSVEATGVFDTATENAIKQIQEENGFEVTGIVFQTRQTT